MERRSFFGWLAALWAGCKSATTATPARAAALPPPSTPPLPRGKPAYHRDGMEFWQHHAPIPRHWWHPEGQQHVAFVRRPAKSERVRVSASSPDEYRDAMRDAGNIGIGRKTIDEANPNEWYYERGLPRFDFAKLPSGAMKRFEAERERVRKAVRVNLTEQGPRTLPELVQAMQKQGLNEDAVRQEVKKMLENWTLQLDEARRIRVFSGRVS